MIEKEPTLTDGQPSELSKRLIKSHTLETGVVAKTVELNHSSQELIEPLYREGNMPNDLCHIEGDILGILHLPSYSSGGSIDIAVVDYGESYGTKMYRRDLASGLGGPESRYGLRGVSRWPRDKSLAVAGFGPQRVDDIYMTNTVAYLGRTKSDITESLSINNNQFELLSREHVILSVRDGIVTVNDVSKNHTRLTFVEPSYSETSRARGVESADLDLISLRDREVRFMGAVIAESYSRSSHRGTTYR